MTPLRNPRLIGFAALDGIARYGVQDFFEGCPRAAAAGAPTSVAAVYEGAAPLPAGTGMARHAARLPYVSFPTLGEGDTPLLPLPPVAGLGALWLKRESANPTGSHKDRMSPLAVARALEVGARGILASSSGNAAISAAAYAAAAGLPCRVIVTPALTEAYRRAIARTGAEFIVCRDSLARWDVAARLVRDEGWFPLTNHLVPPVGSNPFGVEGYKTIAYEIAEALGTAPDAVLVPTARGDLIWGIGAGFRGLAAEGVIISAPRLIAVEPIPRLTRVLAGEAAITDAFPGATLQFSTAGGTATDASLRAISDSGGTAIQVPDAAAAEGQAALARLGFDAELCGGGAHAAIGMARASGALREGETAVMILTAGSAREPAGDPLPPLAVTEGA
ncbi:pyridoxal-phosphate dependent enzyme [Roseomonas hellenica]|uniref:Pyridoxal-phosphate dependent enzyme n=1 Tax=Plastoroseomonas hellenica TaxID=2687306 RepID=A0ABS5F834_9PROT|nr:pyridoxal-phosphate dependent enzyme [Plastoroseomonas hellenica]